MSSYDTLWAEYFVADSSDYNRGRQLQKALGQQYEETPKTMAKMYDGFLKRFDRMVAPAPPRGWVASVFGGQPEPERDAYLFIRAFSNAPYVMGHKARQEAEKFLNEHHDKIAELLSLAIAFPNREVIADDYRTRSGTWGDMVMDVVGLYYWHINYGAEGDALAAKIAPLVAQAIAAYPEAADRTVLSVLEHHRDGVSCFADILRGILEGRELGAECYEMFGHEFFSKHANRDDFWFKKGASILPQALKGTTGAQNTKIASDLILRPLDIHAMSHDQVVCDVKAKVANTNKRLSEPYETSMGLSADWQRDSDAKWLAEYEAELAQVETDFPAWEASRYLSAVKFVAKSATVRRTLKSVVPLVQPEVGDRLSQLLHDADLRKNAPKTYQKAKRGQNQFKDLGLKLLVVQELMFDQAELTPKFNLDTFIAECDTREISVENDGYDPIPEVEAYFKAVATPEAALAKVEKLVQTSGIHPATDVLYAITPFFDAGTGQMPEAVTNKAIADLDLLPNLKKIVGLENSNPNPKLLKALKDRGIEVIGEEDAFAG